MVSIVQVSFNKTDDWILRNCIFFLLSKQIPLQQLGIVHAIQKFMYMCHKQLNNY